MILHTHLRLLDIGILSFCAAALADKITEIRATAKYQEGQRIRG